VEAKDADADCFFVATRDIFDVRGSVRTRFTANAAASSARHNTFTTKMRQRRRHARRYTADRYKKGGDGES